MNWLSLISCQNGRSSWVDKGHTDGEWTSHTIRGWRWYGGKLEEDFEGLAGSESVDLERAHTNFLFQRKFDQRNFLKDCFLFRQRFSFSKRKGLIVKSAQIL